MTSSEKFDTSAEIKAPSNKKFGWSFSIIFLLIAIYSFLNSSLFFTAICSVISVSILTITISSPNKLTSLNRLWFKFGIFLGKVVSPIILGLIFFLMITPISLITRLFGRDILFLRKVNKRSYWIKRVPIGPGPDSFNNQF